MLKKIRQQISKKFGAKGGAVVEGNMAVIREGLEATQQGRLRRAGVRRRSRSQPAPKAERDVAISAAMCRIGGAGARRRLLRSATTTTT